MRLIILLLAFTLFSCSKKPTSQTQSCTFKYVFKSFGSNPMTCYSNGQTDVKTGYYERSENYSIDIGNLVHGSHQVFMKCTSEDSVQCLGYLNGNLVSTGFKSKSSQCWITYTW